MYKNSRPFEVAAILATICQCVNLTAQNDTVRPTCNSPESKSKDHSLPEWLPFEVKRSYRMFEFL